MTVQVVDDKGFEIENNVLLRYSGEETEVKIPKEVKEIGENAVSDNSNLTSVSIPKGVKIIGACVFYNCSNLIVQ